MLDSIKSDTDAVIVGLQDAAKKLMAGEAVAATSVMIGVVAAQHEMLREAELTHEEMARTLAGVRARLKDTLKTLEAVEWSAARDELTGLINQSTFRQMAPRLIEHYRSTGRSVSIIFADLDKFKDINDTYGHNAGDYVLKKMGEIIAEQFRLSDFKFSLSESEPDDAEAYAARDGGEEVCLVLPDTELLDSLIPADRLRRAIEEYDFVYEGQTLPVTISIGVSQLSDSDNWEDLKGRADRALYYVKDNGRNGVASCDIPCAEAPNELVVTPLKNSDAT